MAQYDTFTVKVTVKVRWWLKVYLFILKCYILLATKLKFNHGVDEEKAADFVVKHCKVTVGNKDD